MYLNALGLTSVATAGPKSTRANCFVSIVATRLRLGGMMLKCPASPLADWFYSRGWNTMFHLLYGFESGIPWHCVIEYCVRNFIGQSYQAVRAGCYKSECIAGYVHCTICQWRYHGGMRESMQRATRGRRLAAEMRSQSLLAVGWSFGFRQESAERGRAMRGVPKGRYAWFGGE